MDWLWRCSGTGIEVWSDGLERVGQVLNWVANQRSNLEGVLQD